MIFTRLLTTVMVGISIVLATPLDDYVNTPDTHYNFTFLTSFKAPNATLHILNMTSQKWLDEQWSNRPLWWHYLTIIIPDKLNRTDTSFLWIDMNKNTDKLPTMSDPFVVLMYTIAVSTRTVVTSIKQVPNQPIVFKNDPRHKHRHEDALLSWSMKAFLENATNSNLLIHLPMTKAAVRAMDTVTTYCQKVLHKSKSFTKFFVSGASKRGWIAWLTAAVDKRVIGFAPIVMDLLNAQKIFHHHFRSLGGWSFTLKDYVEDNVTSYLDSANWKQLESIIDPMAYNDRYSKLPKCIVVATGDEFFLPDDSHYFYNDLKGVKYLRVIPNADHVLIGHIISTFLSMRSFYVQVMNAAPMPLLRWKKGHTSNGGKITLWTDREPTSAMMYYARTLNDGRRDFRLFSLNKKTGKRIIHPVFWLKRKVKRISATQYEAEMDKPPQGWAAFFIQVTFDGIDKHVLEFTTELHIVPNTFPFKDCQGLECHGSVV